MTATTTRAQQPGTILYGITLENKIVAYRPDIPNAQVVKDLKLNSPALIQNEACNSVAFDAVR